MDDDAFRDADDPHDGDADIEALNAPIEAPAEPEKRRRGRPPGQPKTGGRKKDTPNWSAASVRNELLTIDGIGELRRIIEGKPMRVSGSTGKSFDAYPSIDQRIKAIDTWLKKVSPDLQSMAVTGADHETPLEVEHSTRDLSRAILDALRSAKISDAPTIDHEALGALANGGPSSAAGRPDDVPAASSYTQRDLKTGEWVGHSPTAGRVRVSPPTDEELRAELDRRGIPYDHSHYPSADEMPREATAEDRMKELKSKNLPQPIGMSGAPRGVIKPSSAPRPPYDFGSEVAVAGCEGKLEFQFQNGDGRMKFFIVDRWGMRHKPVLGSLAEAEQALRDFEEQHRS